MSKYEKESGLPFVGKIPKEDAREAAEIFGEGYNGLTELIYNCIMKDIQTLASCAGHVYSNGEVEHPYILINCNQEDTLRILEQMSKEESCIYIVFLNSDFFYNQNIVPVGLYGEYKNREKFFGKINKCVLERDTNIKPDGKIMEVFKKNIEIFKKNKMNECNCMQYVNKINEFIIAFGDKDKVDIEYNLEEMDNFSSQLLEDPDKVARYSSNGKLVFESLAEMEKRKQEIRDILSGKYRQKEYRVDPTKVISRIKEMCETTTEIGLQRIKQIPRRLRELLLNKEQEEVQYNSEQGGRE